MALQTMCGEGHHYVAPDILDGLASGEPACPVCRANQRKGVERDWIRLTDEVILVGGQHYRRMTEAEIARFEHQQEQFELRWG